VGSFLQRLFGQQRVVVTSGLREREMKKFQRGWGAPDFTGMITGLVIIGIVIGVAASAAASAGIPWLWGMLKPWLHAVTA
jgi:hypothetical protein